MPLTKAPSSNSFAIKPNSTGLNYRSQRFTDFLDGSETGTNGASVFAGDNGSVFELRFATTGARTGNDSSFVPIAQLEPAIGVKFIRTGSSINNRGLLGIQQNGNLPSINNTAFFYSIRCALSSVSDVVLRIGTSSSWSSDFWAATDSVGFELDTSLSANFQALKGTSGGAIVRQDTGIVASASKSYIFSIELVTGTSYRYRIFEQTAANVEPTSVYDQTLTTSDQNDWAFQFGVKTLAASEKILWVDWFLARYFNTLSPASNAIRFPFEI
jgi:hypothetical protein